MTYCRVPLRRQDCNIGQTLDAPHATLTVADASPQGRGETFVSIGIAPDCGGPRSIEGKSPQTIGPQGICLRGPIQIGR
jgi:hypothetical protein